MKIINKNSIVLHRPINKNSRDVEDLILMDCFADYSMTVSTAFNKHRTSLELRFSLGYHHLRPGKLRNEYPTYQSVMFVNMPFSNVFAHCMMDFLPELLWADLHSEQEIILAPKSPVLSEFIDCLDIQFKKTKLVDSSFSFSSGEVFFNNYKLRPQRSIEKLKLLKEILPKNHINHAPNKMIYCTRNSGSRVRSRPMSESNEIEIIELSRQYCQSNGLLFCLFDGDNRDGSPMSILEQICLFREAKIVVGPHGGAFANILSIPENNSCKVCEFTSGENVAVQGVSNFGKNYNNIFAYFSETYLDYYLIPFLEGSSRRETFIDMEDYKNFLSIC